MDLLLFSDESVLTANPQNRILTGSDSVFSIFPSSDSLNSQGVWKLLTQRIL